jgi:hypothetical protein
MHLKIDLMDSWQVAATSSPQRVTVDHFSIWKSYFRFDNYIIIYRRRNVKLILPFNILFWINFIMKFKKIFANWISPQVSDWAFKWKIVNFILRKADNFLWR